MSTTVAPARVLLAFASLVALAACASSGGAPAPPADPAEERRLAAEALAADSGDVDAWFRLGAGWQADTLVGSADSARAAFEALLARQPDHVRGIVHMGLVLEELGQFDEAAEQYRRAIELAPEDPLPHINLGSLLYFHYRKTYEAKTELVRAIELDPDNPDAHFNLGVLFADANMLREAKAEWERVLAVSSEGPARSLAEENLERIRPLLAPPEPTP
jgi:cytochrome c-type biogenesis protein CcmH/NrfG